MASVLQCRFHIVISSSSKMYTQLQRRAYLPVYTIRGSRGRAGDPDPLEIHKDIRDFFSNAGPDPLKNHKATKPAFNVGL